MRPILSKTRKWDMKHMLDIQSLVGNEIWQRNIAKIISFNETKIQVGLNEWKYINDLMDVQKSSNNPNMQDVLHHPQLLSLETKNACAFVYNEPGRPKCNKNRCIVKQQTFWPPNLNDMISICSWSIPLDSNSKFQ